MISVDFCAWNEQIDGLLKYAVVAARYESRWVFCRHKKRTTWEIPGGHREPGEDIEETARRELWEESGAECFDLRPVSVYGVNRDGNVTYGMLFYADITRLGKLPEEMEMAEIRLFDVLPENLTYSEILSALYWHIQGWLNLQSSPDELWDLYDENRNLLGRTHRRGTPLEEGTYHLAVHVWIQTSEGKILLTRRSPNKGFGNMWECTGGSALAGDDSLSAALREVKEETGLTLLAENGRCIKSYKGKGFICDVWLFRQDVDLNEVVLQPGETCGVKLADTDEILRMQEEGTLTPYEYVDPSFFQGFQEEG